jgi:hypothetical protein
MHIGFSQLCAAYFPWINPQARWHERKRALTIYAISVTTDTT